MKKFSIGLIAIINLFIFLQPALAKDSIKTKMHGKLIGDIGVTKRIRKLKHLHDTDFSVLDDFFEEKDGKKVGYGNQDEFLKERTKIIDLLLRYSTQFEDNVHKTSHTANRARKLLVEFDVDVEAKSGIWDFEYRIRAFKRFTQYLLEELHKINGYGGELYLVDHQRVQVIKELLHVRRELAKNYLTMEIITRWHKSKPLDGEEARLKCQELLQSMENLAKDILRNSARDDVNINIEKWNNTTEKISHQIDLFASEINDTSLESPKGDWIKISVLDTDRRKKQTVMGDRYFEKRYARTKEAYEDFFDLDARTRNVLIDVLRKYKHAVERNKIPEYAVIPCKKDCEKVMKLALNAGHDYMDKEVYDEALAYYKKAVECMENIPWINRKYLEMTGKKPQKYFNKALAKHLKFGSQRTKKQEEKISSQNREDDRFDDGEGNDNAEHAIGISPGTFKNLILKDGDWFKVKVKKGQNVYVNLSDSGAYVGFYRTTNAQSRLDPVTTHSRYTQEIRYDGWCYLFIYTYRNPWRGNYDMEVEVN